MQISFSPNCISIYILYKIDFTSCCAAAKGRSSCADSRSDESNVFTIIKTSDCPHLRF